MPSFCETCPLRHKCKGEIQGVKFNHYKTWHTKTGATVSNYRAGAVYDADRNPSLPIFPGVETEESIMKKIDECQEPEIFEKKRIIIPNKEIITCPAIGHLAISKWSDTYQTVANHMRI